LHALTISEVERQSGVPRGVIYFYLDRGLLPLAQKTSATRAIYTDEHVELLRQIKALKGQGLTLDAIKERLADQIENSRMHEVDLAADQIEQRRDAILNEAARQFALKGYDRTRITDIVQALGIAPPQLYSFFPTKHHLFVACYKIFFRWMEAQVEPQAAAESDPGGRLLWRLYANLGIQALSPELHAFAQAEAVMTQDGDLPGLIRATYQLLHGRAIADLRSLRRGGETPRLFSDELVSYALQGAFDNILMRISWDEKFSKRDAMQNLMGVYLAVEAVYQGKLDISERWAEVEQLVDYLSRKQPPGPPPEEME
jgi:AcrR family transcriptional regulator